MLAILVAVILLSLFELQKFLYPVESLQERPSKLYYVLVSFVMGINEEITYRLGLMSLIVAAIQSLKKVDAPTNKMVWTGIIISSLIFGIMHFPVTSNFFELTPFTISVTIIGNLMTGTTFGWLFWKRGLLVAIAAHIAFDITFHVIGTPFG
jgi:membrane protease YdiL (CAAX protease family)